MKEYSISRSEEGQTLLKFLEKTLPGAKGGVLFKAFRKKNIVLNGGKASGKEIIREGDSVKVFFSDEVMSKLSGGAGKKGPLVKVKKEEAKEFSRNIIFEDDNILIVNKWDNILSQPDGSNEVSINDLLLDHLSDIAGRYSVKPSVCNRLDRNTTGLLLCGKTSKGLRLLNDILKDRSIKKYYYAICFGSLDKSLSLKGFLYKDEKENKVIITEREDERAGQGAPVSTEAEPLSKIRIKDLELTLIRVHLITGKPHQIRAHMLYAGFPVMGDIKYCTRESLDATKKLEIKRQLLHAYRIEFPEIKGDMANLSGKTFEAPLQSDMQKLMKYGYRNTEKQG